MRRTCDYFNTRPLTRLIFAFVILSCSRQSHGLDPSKKLLQYAHSSWRLQDGAFGSPPLRMTQTIDGYIWIATQAGLIRFDGVKFVPWAPPGGEELKSMRVWAVLGTQDGSLWIATDDAGLWQWKQQRLTRYASSPPGRIFGLVEGDHGEVWFWRFVVQENAEPLCKVAAGQVTCAHIPSVRETMCCQLFSEDGKGGLWLGAGNVLLDWRPESGVSQRLAVPALSPTVPQFRDALVLSPAKTLVGFSEAGKHLGLQTLQQGRLHKFRISSWDMSKAEILSLFMDSMGALWVGTSKGLFRIFGEEIDRYDASDGLSDNRVRQIYEDRERNIWVVTYTGMDCFRDLAVTTYSSRQGFHVREFDGITATHDGALWVGGSTSLDKFARGVVSSTITGNGLPGNQVAAMLEDNDDRMWIGIDQRLYQLRHGIFQEIKREDNLPFGTVKSLAQTRNGDLWAQTNRSTRELVHLRDGKILETFRPPQVSEGKWIVADPVNGVWLGLLSGELAYFDGHKLTKFEFAGHQESTIEGLLADNDGSVLAMTDTGVIGVKATAGRVLAKANGLPCEVVYAATRDDYHNLWLAAQCGLIMIPSEDVEAWWKDPTVHVHTRVFGQLDGYQPGAAAFQAAARTTDGRLWFVNEAALQMIDPNHLQLNETPPPVHIEDLIIQGRHFDTHTLQDLPPKTHDIEVGYTAPSYVSPQKVLFRYKLEGQDKVWQDAGGRRSAFYTNLRPGLYTFHVIACNNIGLWNEVGDSITFRITPEIYQTGWFASFCGALALFLLWGAYKARLGSARAQVRKELGARMEERERVARDLHDTLLQGFQGLILRFQGVLNTMPAGTGRDSLERALERADEIMSEARQSVKNLRTQDVHDDFETRIITCCEELSAIYGTPFEFSVGGAILPLNPVAAQEAYRIGREALMNAFQHAQASMIQVELVYEKDALIFGVRDNGIGIDESILRRGRTGHWGLTGMRERAEKIGAEFRMMSRPGSGTEVRMLLAAPIAYLTSGRKTPVERLWVVLWLLADPKKFFRSSADSDD